MEISPHEERYRHPRLGERGHDMDSQLASQTPLKGPQLFEVARLLNADASLTANSPNAKIVKVLREWCCVSDR
jgi:hypothetical protein